MTPSMRGARLLIIDDDVLVRTLAAESLKAFGFEIDEAENGSDGLARIDLHRPQLVLLDVMMPGMDGYEVCRTLRTRPQFALLPVIMLTGLEDTASIERAYESGATDFITKPINSTLLANRVRYALRTGKMMEEVDLHRSSLAISQRMAHLGSWAWLPAEDRFEYTEEYRHVIDKETLGPDYLLRDILRQVHPEDLERVARAMDAAIESGEPYAFVYRIMCRNGVERTLHEQVEAVRDSEGGLLRMLGTTQDITERVAAEERMRRLADYDELTGLANRRLFSEVVQRALPVAKRKSVCAAVLHMNLDRFNRVNETLGHAAGDQALKAVSQRIVECIRAGDLAGMSGDTMQHEVSARMGNDGFAVFLSEIRHAEDAVVIAQRLNASIAAPMQIAGHELSLSISVGIAVYPDNGEEVSTLIRNAEAAMHSSRERAAGTFCFFNAEMNTRARAKLDTENELRVAIERDELTLYYQARIDVPTGRLAGAEALVRWQHPTRGLVPPGEFIPVAEETGLIVPLTAWVVRAACRQLQQWQRAGLAMVPVSVNFSAYSFRSDDLQEVIARAMREFEVQPSLLEGEITESTLMQDIDQAVTRLRALRELGIELAMDDFGTGYSSLAYLKKFPINVLKIDRAFVKDVLSDTHDAAIATAIIALGRAMNMSVVAEGMEHPDQANFLLARGCRCMQGFLFARPQPADRFTAILRDGLTLPSGLRPELYAGDESIGGGATYVGPTGSAASGNSISPLTAAAKEYPLRPRRSAVH